MTVTWDRNDIKILLGFLNVTPGQDLVYTKRGFIGKHYKVLHSTDWSPRAHCALCVSMVL